MTIEERLEEVRTEYLRRMTQGNGMLLQQVEQYVTLHDGKMLRPRMTLAAAATLGEEHLSSRRTLLLAVCVEMLHNASLLHDDVIDRAAVRRDRPSVNAQWNNAVAVLVGDYHLAKVMELLEEVGDADASRIVCDTVKTMVEAELLQQEVLAGRELTEGLYLSIVDGKTASLFAAAAALGNPACRHSGLTYGRLFQMRDDLQDHEAPQFAPALLHREEKRWSETNNAWWTIQ